MCQFCTSESHTEMEAVRNAKPTHYTETLPFSIKYPDGKLTITCSFCTAAFETVKEVQTHLVDTDFHNKSLSPDPHDKKSRQPTKCSQASLRHQEPDIIYSQSEEKRTFSNTADLNMETELSCSNDKELDNIYQDEERQTEGKETLPVYSICKVRLKCTFCSKVFDHGKSINAHLVETGFHNKFITVHPQTENLKQMSRCPHCGISFRNTEDQLQHNGPDNTCYLKKAADKFCDTQVVYNDNDSDQRYICKNALYRRELRQAGVLPTYMTNCHNEVTIDDTSTTGRFKRGMDRHTTIDAENFRRNLSSTKEIKVLSHDFAPPTKKLMKGLQLKKDVFRRPGKPISLSLDYIFNRNLKTKHDCDEEMSREKDCDDLVLRNVFSQTATVNDSMYTTKLQRTNTQVHSVMPESNKKTKYEQPQAATSSENATHISNSGAGNLTITRTSSHPSVQHQQQRCEVTWEPAGGNNQGMASGITETEVEQPQKTFNLSSKTNVVVESCKMVQVEPNKWIQVKRYKRVPAQPTNPNKNPQLIIRKKSQPRNKNVQCFQNQKQIYNSTEKDAGEQNRKVVLTAPPRNLQHQKQDSTSIDTQSCQKSDLTIVSLDGKKSQFKGFETEKVQSQKTSDPKEATNGQLQMQGNDNSLQNSPQTNKIQQNKSSEEISKDNTNITSLIQHKDFNTNEHKRGVETVTYVEMTTKPCSNQHEVQLTPKEDHCLLHDPTNPPGSTPIIHSSETSQGEIIYSREGTYGGETAGFLHLLDMMANCES